MKFSIRGDHSDQILLFFSWKILNKMMLFELKGLFIVDIDNTKSIKRNNCVPVVMRLLGGDVEVGGDVSLQ